MKRGHEIMPTALSKFIVTTGLGIYLKMLLVDNLMHADLHPGNIMLDCYLFADNDQKHHHHNDGTITTYPLVGQLEDGHGGNVVESRRRHLAELYGGFYGHITLVDAGMVTKLDDEQSTNFVGLMSSLGEGDGRSAARCVLRFSSSSSSEGTKNDGDSDGDGGCAPCEWDDDTSGDASGLSFKEREAFINDMEQLFIEKCRGYGTNVDLGETLRGVLNLIKKHRVRIEADYATLVVNALCIESLAKRVCPSYNVIDAAKPLLRSHYKLCYGKQGVKSLCHRSRIRQKAIRVMAPALFLQKRAFDNNFFNRIEIARRSRRENQVIRGGGGEGKRGGFSPSRLVLGLASTGIACYLQQKQQA